MNTVSRIKVPCSALEGLRMDKIAVSLDSDRAVNNLSTKCEDMSEHTEYDRAFNNIDVIEGMNIRSIEISKTRQDIKVNMKSFIPIKRYINSIKVFKKYEFKIKG